MNTFKINNVLKLFSFLKEPELTMPLGRWCHVNMPKCDSQVIEKKINFANLDNNICNFNKRILNDSLYINTKSKNKEDNSKNIISKNNKDNILPEYINDYM